MYASVYASVCVYVSSYTYIITNKIETKLSKKAYKLQHILIDYNKTKKNYLQQNYGMRLHKNV